MTDHIESLVVENYGCVKHAEVKLTPLHALIGPNDSGKSVIRILAMKLQELAGTQWAGTSELWLDRLGNDADRSECTVDIQTGAVKYTWRREGKSHDGVLLVQPDGADFTDSFHSPEAMHCVSARDSWCLLDVRGSFSAGEGPEWGWRITLSHRTPSDELVLQMTVIKPWGEEGRAVRMICARK